MSDSDDSRPLGFRRTAEIDDPGWPDIRARDELISTLFASLSAQLDKLTAIHEAHKRATATVGRSPKTRAFLRSIAPALKDLEGLGEHLKAEMRRFGYELEP